MVMRGKREHFNKSFKRFVKHIKQDTSDHRRESILLMNMNLSEQAGLSTLLLYNNIVRFLCFLFHPGRFIKGFAPVPVSAKLWEVFKH